MRAFSFLALLAVAFGACDTSTCYHCLEDPQCGWFEVGGFSDCRIKANVPSSIATPTNCSMCQAGNCADCANQTGCAWYINTNTLLDGACSGNTTAPSSTLGTFNIAAECPRCKDITSCGLCNNATNGSTTCSWYQLPGGADAKCREASPGFAYTKITGDFCGGNPCSGAETCTTCRGINSTIPAAPKPCAWYTPKSALSALYNPKCDVDKEGVLSTTLYTAAVAATCPVCAGSTCTSCKAEANCQWVATTVGGLFGQCVTTGTAVSGKSPVAICSATCQVYSCKECVAKTECRWFTGSLVADDTCDRSTDTSQHPSHSVVSALANCPVCKDSRCFECNSETGCGWYENDFGMLGSTDGDCLTLGTHSGQKLIPNTDKKCAGSPSNAAALAPGLALVLALFVFHN